MTEDQVRVLTGWLGIDAVQQQLVEGVPDFSDVAPHLYGGAGDDQFFLLYKSLYEVLGTQSLPYVPQQIGDCVSHGFSHANDCRQCVEIAMDGSGAFRETDTEFMYGASRVVAGILGPNDGSYGGAVVKAATGIGMVSREMLGAEGVYSGARAKQWGMTGPPAEYQKMAASYKLGSYAKVNNFDDALAAIRNGHPLIVCCGRYGMGERDRDGFIQGYGQGGHCQAILAARLDKPGLMVLNSWPESAYSGPRPLDMPQQGYWLTPQESNIWIATGECFALSSTPYFKRREIPRAWKLDGAAFPTF